MHLTGHKDKLKAVSISADKKHAVSLSVDNHIKVWDIDVRYKARERVKVIFAETSMEFKDTTVLGLY